MQAEGGKETAPRRPDPALGLLLSLFGVEVSQSGQV